MLGLRPARHQVASGRGRAVPAAGGAGPEARPASGGARDGRRAGGEWAPPGIRWVRGRPRRGRAAGGARHQVARERARGARSALAPGARRWLANRWPRAGLGIILEAAWYPAGRGGSAGPAARAA